MTDKWKPEVFFYSVAGIHLSKKGWYKDTPTGVESVKPPIPTQEFLVFLKELSKELGVNCRMVRQEPYSSIVENPAAYDYTEEDNVSDV